MVHISGLGWSVSLVKSVTILQRSCYCGHVSPQHRQTATSLSPQQQLLHQHQQRRSFSRKNVYSVNYNALVYQLLFLYASIQLVYLTDRRLSDKESSRTSSSSSSSSGPPVGRCLSITLLGGWMITDDHLHCSSSSTSTLKHFIMIIPRYSARNSDSHKFRYGRTSRISSEWSRRDPNLNLWKDGLSLGSTQLRVTRRG